MDEEAVHRGQSAYNPLTLAVYDLWVHGVSNHLAWKCPTRELVEWNNRHITANHLDVGVGSGFLLDRATFSTARPRIVLMDLNQASLDKAARRIARYRPGTLRRNILEPIRHDGPLFDSIGLNYLLHCLPGALEEKAVALDHLAALLNPGGVIYGSTIVRDAARQNLLARTLFSAYNRRGIFSNREDTEQGLEEELRRRFSDLRLERHGAVVLFSAYKPESN